jgi:hypothetical protein
MPRPGQDSMTKTNVFIVQQDKPTRAVAGLTLLALVMLISFGVALNSITTSALLVGATVCILALWRPQLGLWGLFIVLPFIYFLKRLEFFIYRDPSSEFNNPVSILPEIIIFVLLVSIGLRALTPSCKLKFFRSSLTWSILAFLGICLLQIVNPSSSPAIGLYGFRASGYYTLAFFLGQYLLRSQKDIYRFMILSLSLSVLVAAYGLWQQFVAVPPWDRAWVLEFIPEQPFSWLAGYEFSWEELRKFSLLKTSVSTALFYVFNILFCVTLYQWRRRLRFVLLTFALMIALIFTYVRGAWLALAAGLVIVFGLWLLRNTTSKRKTAVVSVILVVVVLGGLFYLGLRLSTPLMANLGNGLGRRLASLADPFSTPEIRVRLRMWGRAWDLVRLNPLGIGIGATGGVGERFAGFGVVDNLYLKLSVELGWIGLLLFGVVIWQAMRHAWRVYVWSENRFHRLIAVSVMGLICVVLVDGIVAPTLEYGIAAIYFWFWLGVLDRISGELRPRSRAEPHQTVHDKVA